MVFWKEGSLERMGKCALEHRDGTVAMFPNCTCLGVRLSRATSVLFGFVWIVLGFDPLPDGHVLEL